MQKLWHSLEMSEVLNTLNVDSQIGLNQSDIATRRERYGQNTLTKKRVTSAIVLFLLQFHQPLLYMLLVAAITTAILGEWVNSSAIFGVLFINAVIGFVQESKAIKAINALSNMSKTNAVVIRDAKKIVIDSKDLVVGDIVVLKPGDKISADMRVLRSTELLVNESSLTGESIAADKSNEMLSKDTLLADRKNMLYSSTLVVHGHAVGVVVDVGDSTQIGYINEMISNADILKTPLTEKIDKFSKILLFVILFMSIFTFLIGIMHGERAIDMLMASVAIAVGAIPEGLPAAMTIILAIGVSKIAEKKAIIKKLPAVETLGSVTVICSDKTGTLTQNEMTVKQIYAGGRFYDVSGVGYIPEGDILKDEKKVDLSQESSLKELLIAGVMCSTSSLLKETNKYKINGNPTEGALIVSAMKAGVQKDELQDNLVHIDTLFFESQHQYMASHYSIADEEIFITYIKGSIEKILQRCDMCLCNDGSLEPINRDAILRAAQDLASGGMRVLAFARLDKAASLKKIEHRHLDDGLIFLGLQAMIDPPRKGVIDSIRSCYEAGIKVKMITGDNEITALAIASQIGIKIDGERKSLNGQELENMSDEELAELVESVNVYARVAPEQKLNLVRALQLRSNIVAMTGDGVNDAPALKQANIGVAMGIAGTEVTKESADIILLDDNFSTIRDAVEEGRGVFDNIVKFIIWTLPTNIGEGLVVMFAVFAGVALPVLPIQILWINMTTAVLLGLTLALEPREKNLMSNPPRRVDTPILTSTLLFRIILVGMLLVVGSFGAFWHLQAAGYSVEVARTTTVNVFIFGEIFYLFNCRSIRYSLLEIGLFTNKWLLGGVLSMIFLQLLFTYNSFMNTLFQSAPIGFYEWSIVFSSGIVIFIVVEIEKKIRKNIRKR